MSWTDRIREAAYTSPNGTRQVFIYEDVNEEFTKRGAAFDFANANGTLVQGLGHSGRRFPFRVIFSGENYDETAEKFMELIQERGTGKLEHPIYGVKNVVPLGRIKRRDDLKSAGNQAIIELVFFETLGTAFPTSQDDPAALVLQALEDFKLDESEAFNELTSLDSAVETTTFKNEYQTLLDITSNALQEIADTQEDVRKQFNAIKDSINNGIDILIGDPLTLAFQTIELIATPGRALTSITARLDAYSNLLGLIIDSGVAVLFPGSDSRVSNAFHTKDMYALSYVTASTEAVLNNQFETKVQAIEAAEVLLDMMDDVTVWREDNFESLGEIDTGEAYQQMQNSVALAAGFLVEISFSLKQERIITLDRSRSIVDLEGEIYQTVDENLDFLISSNNLTGDEILELPRGREIVYYV